MELAARTQGRTWWHKIGARVAVVVAAIMAATVLAAPDAAHAAGYTYVWNNNGSNVGVSCVTGSGCATGTIMQGSNGQVVHMNCWFDAASPSTGNYSSPRWFKVIIIPYAGLWYVHSSYVFNQTSVGHC